MSSVFLSYKREDEPRAALLVGALEAEGLAVWWDRSLPGGEEWRANIEQALNSSKCVIVLWTHASVGPDGGFVRDEASRAQARGILVPVRAEAVMPPLGFGEVQAIDLSHWRGSRSDPFFSDLVETVRAKLNGTTAPPARGPAIRLYRRITAGATAVAIAAAILGIGMNALGIQDQLCRVPIGQPGLSDACAAVGLGHLPNRQERIEMQLARGNCSALRTIANDTNHFYSQHAGAALSALTHERSREYTPRPREMQNYLRTSERPHANESLARADALARAEIDARNITCAPREFERLDGVAVQATRFDCRSDPRGGVVCGLDYSAECNISERLLIERCN